MPKNTPTSNRRRAESLSRTLKAQAAIRAEVRRRLGLWLEHVGSEPPDDPSISPAVLAAWGKEVRAISLRLQSGKPQ